MTADTLYEEVYGRLWEVSIREESHPVLPETTVKVRAHSLEEAEESALATVAKRWAPTGVVPTLRVLKVEGPR